MTTTSLLGGGCFWCIDHDLRELGGVLEVASGYTGGSMDDPTYEDVLTERTGHREAVQVTYDPAILSYRHLLQFFIDHIDPTDGEGQFADRGESYSPAIFYATDEERETAESVLAELDLSGVYDAPAAVAVLPASTFFPAEDYHQDYAAKNPLRYAAYRAGSGRASFVAKTCAIREDRRIPWKS